MGLAQVEVIEAGPRDGFQSIKDFIPTEKKLDIIGGLIGAGIRHIQITSFVSPKAVPQMQDAAQVAKACVEKYPDIVLSALTPNFFGARAASAAGLHKISYVISLSKTHNKANVNRTHEQSFEELDKILQALPDLDVCVDIATAFGCPFEGISDDIELEKFIEKIYNRGVREICLCDTAGLSNPAQIRRIINNLKPRFSECTFQIHIHDTRGMGLVNTLAAIEAGITKVQSTVGGIGGCPFAPGASGNTSTEDLVYMLKEMGYQTKINFPKLIITAKSLQKTVKGNYSGHHIQIENPRNPTISCPPYQKVSQTEKIQPL